MAKGQDYEREICRKLSLWWTDGENDDVLWRTSQSGGRATTRAQKGKDGSKHCGDITWTDPVAAPLLQVVSIEIKKGYPRTTIHDLLDSGDPQIKLQPKKHTYKTWFAKAERDSKQAGALYWLLIHMRTRRKPLVWMPMEMMNTLMGIAGMGDADESSFHMCLNLPNLQVCCEPLDAFLAEVEPKHFLALLEKSDTTEPKRRVNSDGRI